MLKDSNTVERSALDPDKAYIQITYVEPYFDLFEYEKRKCFFDLNYGLSKYGDDFCSSRKTVRFVYKNNRTCTSTSK